MFTVNSQLSHIYQLISRLVCVGISPQGGGQVGGVSPNLIQGTFLRSEFLSNKEHLSLFFLSPRGFVEEVHMGFCYNVPPLGKRIKRTFKNLPQLLFRNRISFLFDYLTTRQLGICNEEIISQEKPNIILSNKKNLYFFSLLLLYFCCIK